MDLSPRSSPGFDWEGAGGGTGCLFLLLFSIFPPHPWGRDGYKAQSTTVQPLVPNSCCSRCRLCRSWGFAGDGSSCQEESEEQPGGLQAGRAVRARMLFPSALCLSFPFSMNLLCSGCH